ncbi:MAG: TonB-dependent receptor plug domain-containing protein, partial [Bacteroidales bacterium]|nr:TonB-dependent receptor plug domain-containing protein [Bacteroidales bacterium]
MWGFAAQQQQAPSPINAASDTLSANHRLDSIVVQAHRAGVNTPVTYSEVSGYKMRKENASHSLPMMLALQPSVVATTEGGLGLGYSNFSVRGTDDTRTNVTLNGISLNDSESQKVFWVNMPAIHQFTSSVQLERGVGTSAAGSGAFGANLSIVTSSLCTTSSVSASFGLGSYNTFMSSVAAATGLSKSGLYFNVVYSHGETDGYIRNAKADLNSLYTTAGWRSDKGDLSLTYIYGDQCTGITWEGISPQMYEIDRKYNIAGEYYDEQGNVHYYDNETDNYTQHHVQASYTYSFNDFLKWNTSLNYTRGDG